MSLLNNGIFYHLVEEIGVEERAVVVAFQGSHQGYDWYHKTDLKDLRCTEEGISDVVVVVVRRGTSVAYYLGVVVDLHCRAVVQGYCDIHQGIADFVVVEQDGLEMLHLEVEK